MRFGLDGTPVWGPPVGQYTYMASLINSLVELETDHEFVVYCRREIPEEFNAIRNKASFHVCGFKNRKFCEQLSIPFYANRDGLDLLHTCWCRPYLYRGRNVFNIMGLEWRTHPGVALHSRVNNWYYKTTIESTCRKADRLIAISDFMRRTFVERMEIPEENISVVYLGVDLDMYYQVREQERLDAVREKYQLPERFMLFVGALLANKNLERVVRAFHALKKESRFKDLGFVVAGGKAWNSSPIYELVKELGLAEDVIFTGFIPQEDKLALYNLAEVYAFPSLVEGFGLPVLEAMACGTAVVTSNVTAMPEVAGDAAALVDPLNQEQLTEALRNVLADDTLRQDLVEKGLKRVHEFTWEKTARNMLKVYEETVQQ
jgi:glycosyltransferase involved in cell wall biosynthesis